MRNKSSIAIAVLTAIVVATAVIVYAGRPQAGQPMADCPMQHMHDQHRAGLNERGAQAMGFDQTKTTHHFRLTTEGGVIKVEANDPSDTGSRDQIRQHLIHITRMFAEGNFDAPLLVHTRLPPGVRVMQRLKTRIGYTFESTRQGGYVRISTSDPEVLAAIHEFLRFQIKNHQTGDPLEVKPVS